MSETRAKCNDLYLAPVTNCIMRLFILVLFTFSLSLRISAQNSTLANEAYSKALTLFQDNKLFESIAEFENAIKLDPNHTDALYNLAVINYQLKDHSTAIRLLKRGARLNDSEAIKFLKDKFPRELTYADTMQRINVHTLEKFIPLNSKSFSSLSDFTKQALLASSDKKEQLHLLLLWAYNNMSADSSRFFYGGNPLSLTESFQSRIGLCDEFSNLVTAFCKEAHIPNFKVLGYVKYPGFIPGDPLYESNHAWNVVNINSTWLVCDLFWSVTSLEAEGSQRPHFIQRLNTDYFLGHPDSFLNDHLPCDPVFQLQNTPITSVAFAKHENGIDHSIKRMGYLNYKDSLTQLAKMSPEKQQLRIAKRSYLFNPANPNELISENYNYAVDVINKKTATRSELVLAQSCLQSALSVIGFSKNDDIKALKPNCEMGLSRIKKRLTDPNIK